MRTGEKFTIFNVYAPCDSNRQQVLWQNLLVRLASLDDQNVCVCGDFNVVLFMEVLPTASVHFNKLIVDSCLVELPLWGRRCM